MAEHDVVYVNEVKQAKKMRKVKCPRPTDGPHYIDWEGMILKKQKEEREKAAKERGRLEREK